MLESEKCGCFYCLAIFTSDKITKWIDEDKEGIGKTALCPECEIDSVIGDRDVKDITPEFLQKMHAYWF